MAAKQYRKQHKLKQGKIKQYPKGLCEVQYGEIGLKSLGVGRLTPKQLETVRITLVRALSKKCKISFLTKPQLVVTKKAAETRMGSGKGNPEDMAFLLSKGKIILKVSGVKFEDAKAAFKQASYKLPVPTKAYVGIEAIRGTHE